MPSNYARIAKYEDPEQRPSGSSSPTTTRLQWVCIAVLTITAGVLLVLRLTQPPRADVSLDGTVLELPTNATIARARAARRARRWQMGMAMGRTGHFSSFYQGLPPRRIKGQAAKAATRAVVLIGSHFEQGNALLKRVFGELCQRPRLSLRCESSWGGPHDLKSLASVKGGKRRRIVWLESDAGRLRSTVRAVRAHASDFRLVHLIWDPQQACAAQWSHTGKANNASLGSLCSNLHLEMVPPLYKRAKRDRARSLQLRLEDLVRRKASKASSSSASGPAAWRLLFKFLDLPEKVWPELATVASRAVGDLGLRDQVLGRDAPPWVGPAILRNSSLDASLRRLRTDLDYGQNNM